MADVTLTDARIATDLGEEQREADSILRLTVRRFFKHRMAVSGMVLLGLIVLFVVGGALFVTEAYANKTSVFHKFEPPSAEHAFGTDQVGRDILARTIYGGQISLMIGVVSVVISVSLGTLVGLVAGYFGGWIDAVLMRLVEALLSIPTLILLLMLSRILAGSTSTVNVLGRELSASAIAIVGIIGLTGWMSLSRIVRSMVLTLKEQEFIQAAQMIGARNGRIIRSHILPNCIAPIVVAATLGVGNAIIVEAYLSFLGFGVMPPTATWGNILTRAQELIDEVWWMWMAPGVLIILTVLAINFIGDGLRDALDPRMRKE
jgi:peptide/nickel transport system permease protein